MKTLGFSKFFIPGLLALFTIISYGHAYRPSHRHKHHDMIFELLQDYVEARDESVGPSSPSKVFGTPSISLKTTLTSTRSTLYISSDGDKSDEQTQSPDSIVVDVFQLSSFSDRPSHSSRFHDSAAFASATETHQPFSGRISSSPSNTMMSVNSTDAKHTEAVSLVGKHNSSPVPVEHQHLPVGYILWPSLLAAVFAIVFCTACCHMCSSTSSTSSVSSTPRRRKGTRRRAPRAPNTARHRGVHFPPSNTKMMQQQIQQQQPLSRFTSRASRASNTSGDRKFVYGRSSPRDEDIPMLVPVDPRDYWMGRENSRGEVRDSGERM